MQKHKYQSPEIWKIWPSIWGYEPNCPLLHLLFTPCLKACLVMSSPSNFKSEDPGVAGTGTPSLASEDDAADLGRHLSITAS